MEQIEQHIGHPADFALFILSWILSSAFVWAWASRLIPKVREWLAFSFSCALGLGPIILSYILTLILNLFPGQTPIFYIIAVFSFLSISCLTAGKKIWLNINWRQLLPSQLGPNKIIALGISSDCRGKFEYRPGK